MVYYWKAIVSVFAIVKLTKGLYLEYVGEIAEIEDVVELDGGGKEGGGDAMMEVECQLDQL